MDIVMIEITATKIENENVSARADANSLSLVESVSDIVAVILEDLDLEKITMNILFGDRLNAAKKKVNCARLDCPEL